jgi:hypothetical protein
MTDMMLSSTFDEPLASPQADRDNLFTKIDDVLQRSIAQNDPIIALQGVKQLEQVGRITGLGLAKLLWAVQDRWADYNTGEEFRDYVIEHTSLAWATVTRYCLVWEMYQKNTIPAALIDAIQSKTMRDQVEIAKIEDRVDMKMADWKRIAKASNGREIIEIKRELTNLKPRKSGFSIKLRRNGDLEVWDSKHVRHHVGFLNVDDAKTNDIIQKAIDRIVRNTGIMEE